MTPIKIGGSFAFSRIFVPKNRIAQKLDVIRQNEVYF
jgi:hypothetical protein